MYQIWAAMEKEDALKLVFYEKYAPDTTPISTHADLPFVMEYFCDPKKIIILVTGDNDELAGVMWFDGIIPDFKLFASYWFRRKYWGHASREACKIGIDWVFNDLKIPAIWSVTPWLTSVKTTNTLGFEYLVALPDATLAGGKVRDLHISVLRKEAYYGRRG